MGSHEEATIRIFNAVVLTAVLGMFFLVAYLAGAVFSGLVDATFPSLSTMTVGEAMDKLSAVRVKTVIQAQGAVLVGWLLFRLIARKP